MPPTLSGRDIARMDPGGRRLTRSPTAQQALMEAGRMARDSNKRERKSRDEDGGEIVHGFEPLPARRSPAFMN